MPARERYPLVLQLDTFVETTRRKPALRGPRLHVLKPLLCTSPKGDLRLDGERMRGAQAFHSVSPGWMNESGCQLGAAVARKDACSLDTRTARTRARSCARRLSRRQNQGRSTTPPPEPARRQKLAVATDGPAVLDQAVNGSGAVAVSNCSDASLTIWTMGLCCRHRYARR